MDWFWQALFLLIFTVPLIVLFAYSAWDVVRRRDAGAAFKALWLVGFIVFPIVGPLVYLVIRSPGSAEQQSALAEERASAGMPAAGSVREQRGGQVL
jgi:heme/copper-type cytochrome/quinol oxidase subunit 2